MGTGRYALGLNFNGATPPTEASPIVAVPNGNPAARRRRPGRRLAWHGRTAAPTPSSPGSPPTTASAARTAITNNPRISIFGTAPAGDTITVY